MANLWSLLHQKGALMKSTFRIPALVLLTGVASIASAQTASTASWNLGSGSVLTFSPDSGKGKIHIAYLEDGRVRITVLTSTSLTVSPDPAGTQTNRTWTLAGGTELTLDPSNCDFQISRSGNSTILTLVPVSNSGVQALVAAPSPSALVQPDPGEGK